MRASASALRTHSSLVRGALIAPELVLVLRPPCRAMFHPDAIQNDPEIERNGSQFAGASAEHDAPSAPARSPPLLPSRD